MYIFNVDRPKQAIEDYHVKGTTATIKFAYHELVLIEHALIEYKKNREMTEEDRLFEWQFSAFRAMLKDGVPDTFSAERFVHEFKGDKTVFKEIEEKKKRLPNRKRRMLKNEDDGKNRRHYTHYRNEGRTEIFRENRDRGTR